MGSEILLSGSIAAPFALIHLIGGRLNFLRTTPRSVWLSAAGGVSVAYVFVHLPPELAEYQEALGEALAAAVGTGAYAPLLLASA